MPEFITIGETMAAFSPCEAVPLRYADRYSVRIAGAESNTAIGIQKLGHSARWISRLGTDEFSALVLQKIRAEGVDTSCVVFDPEYACGIMFKEKREAGDPRVFYYRKESAASFLSPNDITKESFTGAKLLHLTGITPILSGSCRLATERSVTLAKEKGLLFSFDPNIRQRLWKKERDLPVLHSLCLQADIVLLGLDEAQMLFNAHTPQDCCERIFMQGRAHTVAVKMGSKGSYCASRQNGGRLFDPIPCHPADTVGAGDAFNAGFLSGILENADFQECAARGNAAGGLVAQVTGDIEGQPSKDELRDFLAGREECKR